MLKKVKWISGLLSAALLLFACQNPITEGADRTGTLVLRVNPTGSRTIIPEIVPEISEIKVTLEGPSGQSVSQTFDVEDSISISSLALGPWSLQVEGKNAEGGVVAKSSSIVFIQAGSNSHSVTLEPNLQGVGNFSLDVAFPPSASIDSIQVRATPYGEEQGEFNELSFSGSSFQYGMQNISAGYYIVEIHLFQGETLKSGLWEVLWVVNGITTRASIELSVDDMELPQAPGDFSLSSSSEGIVLNWTDRSSIETGYRIERSLDGVTYSYLTALPSGSTTFTDGAVTQGTDYYYRIKALGVNGDSSWVHTQGTYSFSGETGDIEITITLIDPQDLPEIFDAIGDLGSQVVTIESLVPGATNYSWRIDGIEVGTDSSYELDPGTLAPGLHSLALIVMVNGTPYSQSVNFWVLESNITQTPVLRFNSIVPGEMVTLSNGTKIHQRPASFFFEGEGNIHLTLEVLSSLGSETFNIVTVPGETNELPIPLFIESGTENVSYSFTFYGQAEGKEASPAIQSTKAESFLVEVEESAGFTVYVQSASGAPTIWAWIEDGSAVMDLEGHVWPGPDMDPDGENWYRWDLPASYLEEVASSHLNVIINAGSTQILTQTSWFTGTSWVTVDPRAPSAPSVSISPPGGSIQNTREVTISYSDNGSGFLSRSYTIDGETTEVNTNQVILNLDASGLSEGQTISLSAQGANEVGSTSAGPVVFTKTNQVYTIPDTLGALYTPRETVFRIWSPDHSNVAVFVNGTTFPMTKRANFNGYSDVYEVSVPGDLKLEEYQFRINGVGVRDPYGKMIKPNTNVNIVMDMASIEPEGGWVGPPPLDHRTDTIIYEVHIRDFTQHNSWNGSEADRGRYLGMVETGTSYMGEVTGIDHLKEMGVTHVQILPFYDFATPHYNWGYDPKNWNVPEEQYSAVYAQNPEDYEGRVREVMNMVNEFHKNGLRVIMDVVYNHTFGDEMFEDITELYYTGNNDSGTGNGINTGVPMVSRLIRDSQEFWLENYKVDGFRHDLMGIFHTEEVRKWGQYLNNEKFPNRNLVIFGEPWNGYFADAQEGQKVRYGTVHQLADANIGVFNGGYREAIKGQSDEPAGGFMFNKLGHHKTDGGWGVYDGMRGSPYTPGDPNSGSTWGRNYAAKPAQTVNYISAHDNFGLWDRVYIELATNVVQNQSKQVMSFTPPVDLDYGKRIVKFGMGMIFTSQGIAFTHAGDEFLRTKTNNANMADASAWRFGQHGGTHNTYNSPDSFNMIRWNWKVENKATYDYFRDLIAIRNNHPGLRMRTNQDIAQYLTMGRPTAFGGQVITGHIQYPGDTHDLFVVYNSGNNQSVTLPSGTWTMIANAQGAVNVSGLSGSVISEGTSVTIFSRPR